MSAERECFKKMDKLAAEKADFDARYMEQGIALVKEAIVEFMLDHPEVQMLRWSQDTQPASPFIYDVRVLMADQGVSGFQDAKSLVESNSKLSVCLSALETKFNAMSAVLCSLYGTEVRVSFLNEGKTSLSTLNLS